MPNGRPVRHGGGLVCPLYATEARVIETKLLPLGILHSDVANARTHDARNLLAIKESLARFGQVSPLIVQKDTHRVIGGNGRLEVMRQVGWRNALCALVECSDSEATALSIALNRSAELASWDEDTLATLLGDLQRQDIDLDVLGFTSDEMDKILQSQDPGEPEPPKGVDINSQYLVIIKCQSEAHQQEIMDTLKAEGRQVKAMFE